MNSLAIPPAWTDVWISPDPAGHIQAVGIDGAGRRQYIYHQAWRERRDRDKFARALVLAESLGSARRVVARELSGETLSRARLLAASFRLIDAGSLRVGSEQYLHANGSRGLTTLICRQLAIEGSELALTFRAKSGRLWHSTLVDPDLARVFSAVKAARGPRSRLLSWRDRRWHSLHATDVNDYIRELTRGTFTAKDFRTLRGTTVAAQTLAELGPADSPTAAQRAIATAVRAAADALGNTPAVARTSYVDPRVLARYRAGRVLDTSHGRTPEHALIALISPSRPAR